MSESRNPVPSVPVPERARQRAYRESARSYDRKTSAFQDYRQAVVEALPVRRGQVVLDVGCGTGRRHGPLLDKVGPQGGVVGIEESPDMVAVARERIEAEGGWGNVTVVQSSAEDAQITQTADAALFCAVHDILQSEDALANVLGKLRPGAPGGRRRRQVGATLDGRGEPAGDDAPRPLCAELQGVPAALAPPRAAARGRARPGGRARQRLHPHRPGTAAGPAAAAAR